MHALNSRRLEINDQHGFPISALQGSATQSVESWNRDLRDSMGACWRARPPFGCSTQVSYKMTSIGEVSLLGLFVSSPIEYFSAPRDSFSEDGRMFFVHMANTSNRMSFHGEQIVQRPGECMVGDSNLHTTSACDIPHSTLCAGFPAKTFRTFLPDAERLIGKHFDPNSTYSRIVPTFLSSLFRMAAAGSDAADGRLITVGLLKSLAQWCALSTPDFPPEENSKIRYEQVKQLINANIRDSALSVASIAKKVGVSSRYLQLLFARERDSVSRYIKQERLRGCLLDLRDIRYSDKSITEIAFSWGFNSASHFSSLFRREFLVTARECRTCHSKDLAGFPNDDILGLLVLASEQRYS